MHCIVSLSGHQSAFQSAPGREAGRCLAASLTRNLNSLFQSAPGREAGRCRRRCARWPARRGFNPRPAVRPGDASNAGLKPLEIKVSIRARP